jgi:4-alpha-glucanotransferase
MARHAGLMLPLFSATASTSWGIGELPDIVPLAQWMGAAGFSRLMLLPIGTMPDGETSPYSAVSAMAIDPIYIAPAALEDFHRVGGGEALSADARAALETARHARTVPYPIVRRIKLEALDLAFSRFFTDEWGQLSLRASALAAYIARERWWLDDYALYQAIAGLTGHPAWRAWAAPLRDRDPAALDEVRRRLSREILRHQYVQWIAESQWQTSRAHAHAAGVTLLGDLPFMVAADSADVWVRPGEFRLDVALGVPPDAFSATGQDWGMPTYNWPVIEQSDYVWLRQRARRMAALFDGYRVDHLVGLYRTFGRPENGEPFFTPADESSQIAQGERILQILIGSGAEIIAEDLGVVPDFVRDSLARLNVPGCKVQRWERQWLVPGHPFVDPVEYPAVSAAMTGTHDTETLAAWWDAAPRDERAALAALPSLHAAGLPAGQPWNDALRDHLLHLMWHAGSNELLLPVQDLFGWRDRINIPGTVGDHNWSWRLPWPVDRLHDVPLAHERAAFARRLAHESGRGPAGGATGTMGTTGTTSTRRTRGSEDTGGADETIGADDTDGT